MYIGDVVESLRAKLLEQQRKIDELRLVVALLENNAERVMHRMKIIEDWILARAAADVSRETQEGAGNGSSSKRSSTSDPTQAEAGVGASEQ